MSTALQLDLLAAPASGWRWAGWLGLVAASLCLAWVADRHLALQAGLDELQQRHDTLALRAQPVGPPQRAAPPDASTQRGLQRANTVIDQLSVPWNDLFAAIEAVPTRGVSVLQLAPSAAERTLRLSGQAAALPQVLAYVERLAAQPALGQVHLLGYETAQREGGQAVVTFSLLSAWRAP